MHLEGHCVQPSSFIDAGTENALHNVNDESVIADKDCSGYSTIETNSVTGIFSNGVQDQETSEHFESPIEKVVY